MARRSMARLPKFSPSSTTDPDQVSSTPEMARSRVVLPAPLAPNTDTISPSSTDSETPCSTSRRP